MSHELRTPMNAILGFAQLLEADPDEPLTDAQAPSVKQILKSGEHLLELINEVLDLVTVETGKVALTIESLDVPDIVQSCLEITHRPTSARSIWSTQPRRAPCPGFSPTRLASGRSFSTFYPTR